MNDTIEVEFTAHAELRIAKRKLDREQVEAVARAPEQIIRKAGELPVAQSRIQFKDKPFLLRVVFRDVGNTRLVVSAYRTSQVRRYWQEEEDEN